MLLVSIQDDNIVMPTYDPNDTFYQSNLTIWLWSNISGYHPRWYLLDIQAPQAWDIYRGDPNAGIGIMEAYNVRPNHPDIQPKILFNSAIGLNFDPWGRQNVHGTQVAGIAAAVTDNNFGIAGVDHNAKILAGSPLVGYSVNSMPNYSNIRVYNHSYATGAYLYGSYNPFERSLFAYSYNLDNVNVLTSGNWRDHIDDPYFMAAPNDPLYPGFYQNGLGAIVVGGTNYLSSDIHPGSQTGSHLDIVAGGTYMVSSGSSPTQNPAPNRWDDYHSGSSFGTSFAAPQVAGVASLLIGYAKNVRGMYLTNDDVEGILKATAVKIGGYADNAKGWNLNTGHGKLNAYRALDAIRGGTLQHRVKQSDLLSADIASESAVFNAFIIGCPNMADGYQNVKRYEVQTTVALPYAGLVWGNGAWMQYGGLAPEDIDINGNRYVYGMGFCEAVTGTYTGYSTKLRTYVYQIHTPAGQPTGVWFPCSPEQVYFHYTVFQTPYNSLSNQRNTENDRYFLQTPSAGDRSTSMATNIIEKVRTFPTPASDYVNIDFTLHDITDVEIAIIDMQGTVVHTESLHHAPAGTHTTVWKPQAHHKGAFSIVLTCASAKKVQRVETKTIIMR